MIPEASNLRTEMFGTCPLPTYQYDRILLGHGRKQSYQLRLR